jgi:hypothetical protein
MKNQAQNHDKNGEDTPLDSGGSISTAGKASPTKEQ